MSSRDLYLVISCKSCLRFRLSRLRTHVLQRHTIWSTSISMCERRIFPCIVSYGHSLNGCLPICQSCFAGGMDSLGEMSSVSLDSRHTLLFKKSFFSHCAFLIYLFQLASMVWEHTRFSSVTRCTLLALVRCFSSSCVPSAVLYDHLPFFSGDVYFGFLRNLIVLNFVFCTTVHVKYLLVCHEFWFWRCTNEVFT